MDASISSATSAASGADRPRGGGLHHAGNIWFLALTALGVQAGDRVAIYMPMLPETVFAMLACARIGAPHSVVFAAFSSEALRSRIEDAGAKVLITVDGYNRRGGVASLKPNADAAVEGNRDDIARPDIVMGRMSRCGSRACAKIAIPGVSGGIRPSAFRKD